jgi:hypothetical protein
MRVWESQSKREIKSILTEIMAGNVGMMAGEKREKIDD